METVHIVMASNDRYAIYLGVALYSLIRHTAQSTQYHIYILENHISAAHKRQIMNLRRDNVSIEFIDVAQKIPTNKITRVNHLSVEATFRLLVADVFRDLDKIIYLDCDVIVCRDVAKLYAEDVNGFILAATRARLEPNFARYIENTLKLPLADYFNSGVLVINLNLWRVQHIGETALHMLMQRNYYTLDQDVLNLLGLHQVKYLDDRWNVEWGHLIGDVGAPVIDEVRKGSLMAVDDPFIVHYTTFRKPWSSPELPLADIFWQEARQTVFYEDIILQNSLFARVEADVFRWFVFPWRLVRPGSQIIIYGSGAVGKAYCEQLLRTQYCKIVAVCDKNIRQLTNLDIPTISREELVSKQYTDYECIVIAVRATDVAEEICCELVSLGLPEDKLIWANPLRRGGDGIG